MEIFRSKETIQEQPEEQTSLELLDALKADDELRDFLDEQTREFIVDCEFGDALGYVYGLLLEQGYDPDVCLERVGILEASSDDD